MVIGFQAAALTARGHEVTVVAGRGRGPRAAGRLESVRQLDSKYPPLVQMNRELRAGRVPPEFGALRDELVDVLGALLAAQDVCIVHNAFTLHFNLPLTAALFELAESGEAAPFVAWCHDLSWTNPLYKSVVYDRYPWSLLKCPAPRTRYVVVSADRRADLSQLTGLGSDEIEVVPAGVDLTRKWALHRTTRTLLREYGLVNAEPFLLLPARITRRKNIELAIRITGALRDLGHNPRLLVTGPRGPHDATNNAYLAGLLELTTDLGLAREVILLQAGPSPSGRRWHPSDAMMDELYRAADLLVMPSSQEGFGIPLLEAAVVNLPIFCSDIPAFRETAGKLAGFFELDESPSAIAQRISLFLRGDDRYQLRKQVLRGNAWDAIFDRKVVPLLEGLKQQEARPARLPAEPAGAGVGRSAASWVEGARLAEEES
jgi:glycosyltransferase involved in cell wall biosynthesis